MAALQVIFVEVDFSWNTGSRELTTPFDELAGNVVFMRNLESAAFMLAQIQRYHGLFDDELRRMHEELAVYLGEEVEAAP